MITHLTLNDPPAPAGSPTIWQPGINRDEVHREYVVETLKTLTDQIAAMRTELRSTQDLLRSLSNATHNNALSASQLIAEAVGRESAAEFDRQFIARLPELIAQVTAELEAEAAARTSNNPNPDNRNIDPNL